MNKTQRILIIQNGKCALCQEPPHSKPCRDRTDKVVCRRCNLYLAAWRTARAAGITEQDTVVFNQKPVEQLDKLN